MHYFQYRGDELYCEAVAVEEIARQVGTPFYLYSCNTFQRHYRVFDEAFAGVPHIICFAMKANSNIAILSLLARQGSGMDIVSGGELHRALKAGVSPDKIVYAGVGKTKAEIEYALECDILMFNIESPEELLTINEIAKANLKKARVALRVNPDVDPKTHPYISTGLKKHKFGINIKDALEHYRLARELSNVDLVGIHTHIGSQIEVVSPFVEAADKVADLSQALKAEGIDIKYINVGGGLGIKYKDEAPPHPSQFALALSPHLKRVDCTFIFEPGRVIAGNAGVLVAKVLYTKSNHGKNFIIVDAAMNDLIRPSLYGSYHEIIPVRKGGKSAHELIADVVGPVCESGDFLAKDRAMPRLNKDDLIAVMGAGSYGFSMASNYNSRPRPAEVLVKDARYSVIRQREGYEDLIRGESIPDFL